MENASKGIAPWLSSEPYSGNINEKKELVH
jgi:hypothetical protein